MHVPYQAISHPVRRIFLTKGLSLYSSDTGKAFGSTGSGLILPLEAGAMTNAVLSLSSITPFCDMDIK